MLPATPDKHASCTSVADLRTFLSAIEQIAAHETFIPTAGMTDTTGFFCTGYQDLTIERLIQLAQVAYNPRNFPNEAHYVLHDSFDSLQEAADAGCAFCSLIVTTLHGYENDTPEWIAKSWRGAECEPGKSLFHYAQGLSHPEVKVSIGTGNDDAQDEFARVKVLDRVMVQIGANGIIDQTGSEYEDFEDFPVLAFQLMSSRGMLSN